MRRIPKRALPHTVKTSIRLGENSKGPVYSPPRTLKRGAYVEDKRRLVKDRNGSEVTSTTTVVLPPSPELGPDDRVTIWVDTPREREARVITVSVFDHPQAPGHQVLYLE